MGFVTPTPYDERVPPIRPLLQPGFFGPDDPAPFRVVREGGQSPIVLICDHASCAVPAPLRSLGLEQAVLQSHIGWDIGAAEVATLLADSLDAILILQGYSRLVIDCNRPLTSAASIAMVSDNIAIPGNADVTGIAAGQRAAAIFTPYHERIQRELDSRSAQQRAAVLVSVHSFTPLFQGFVRPWHIGTLYNRDSRLAQALMRELRADPTLVIGDNEPYAASDSTDFAIPQHGELRHLLHVGIEMRQDLISDRAGQRLWACRLSETLGRSLGSLAST